MGSRPKILLPRPTVPTRKTSAVMRLYKGIYQRRLQIAPRPGKSRRWLGKLETVENDVVEKKKKKTMVQSATLPAGKHSSRR